MKTCTERSTHSISAAASNPFGFYWTTSCTRSRRNSCCSRSSMCCSSIPYSFHSSKILEIPVRRHFPVLHIPLFHFQYGGNPGIFRNRLLPALHRCLPAETMADLLPLHRHRLPVSRRRYFPDYRTVPFQLENTPFIHICHLRCGSRRHVPFQTHPSSTTTRSCWTSRNKDALFSRESLISTAISLRYCSAFFSLRSFTISA